MANQGSLRLPTTVVGLGAVGEAEIHSEWNTFDSVKHELEDNLGFRTPTEPPFEAPTLSVDDLTELHGKDYTEKYLQFMAWMNFSNQVVAYHAAKIIQFENETKHIEASMREGMRNGSSATKASGERKAPPLAEMADKIRLHPRVKDLGQSVQYHEQFLLIARANAFEYENSVKLLSRQIEIKKLEFESSNREGNMGRMRTPVTGGQPAVVRHPVSERMRNRQ